MGARPPLDEVVKLELRLLDPSVRARPDEIDRLLHEEFTEIGASGRRWDRASTIALLATDPGSAPEVSDVAARALADEVVLITYLAKHAADEGTASLRSSLWVKADDAWKVLFHQGTPVSPSALDG
jgi:hypothetical protein